MYECSVIFIFRRRSNRLCVEPPVPGRKIEDEGAPLDGDGGGDVDADGDPGGKDGLLVVERSHHQGDKVAAMPRRAVRRGGGIKEIRRRRRGGGGG